ncbi:MAG: hypothetical protein ABI325_02320 [Ginsengibacter sp.]
MYGENIPKEVKSIERISYTRNGAPGYQLYEGKPLRESTSEKDIARLIIIAGQRIAVSL